MPLTSPDLAKSAAWQAGRLYPEQTSVDPEHLQNKSDARGYRSLTAV
ncbi:uncharacterized protein An12g08160 [Aspergillus niger]|uniref:Contig An12c0270, genomic contig n=2 Tax=Aspergillus niger TaxID=5061 RepID=A2R0C8_ASPNC|nr:uncharacterized protein An12g08160 [Aspergillus niger]CAK41266.1 unnamed protein product [Aspergillus niger]